MLAYLPSCVFRGAISGGQCECLNPRLTAPLNQVLPLVKCDGCRFASTDAVVTRKRRWFPEPETPCRHRGGELRTEECKPCLARGNQTTIPVFQCELHGECSERPHKLRGNGRMIPNCLQCDDFVEGEEDDS